MKDKSLQASEHVYKQSALETASVPRVVLMLYDRILLFFTQAKEQLHSKNNLSQSRLHLQQASLVLSHLLRVFLQSDEIAYQDLYRSHEQLRQSLMFELQKNTLNNDLIQEMYASLSLYRRSWRQNLQIRSRSPLDPSDKQADSSPAEEVELSCSSVPLSKKTPQLNVRRKPECI